MPVKTPQDHLPKQDAPADEPSEFFTFTPTGGEPWTSDVSTFDALTPGHYMKHRNNYNELILSALEVVAGDFIATLKGKEGLADFRRMQSEFEDHATALTGASLGE